MRKMIALNVAGEFTKAEVIRMITSTLKAMFKGPWISWKDVDSINREALWDYFKGMYQWEAKFHDNVIQVAWQKVMKKRFSDTLKNARDESLRLAKAANVNESKLKCPPTRLELFQETHRIKKPKDGISNTEYITPKAGIVADMMKTRYSDDHELWVEVTGGVKKGIVLGFGSVSDLERFLVPSLAAPSTSSDNIEVIVDRIREELKEELKSERKEMKQELMVECAEANKEEMKKM